MKQTLFLILIMSTFLMYGQSGSKKIKAYQAVVFTESNKYVGFLYSADSMGISLTQDEKEDRFGLQMLKPKKSYTFK